jgi:hypothetical protein
LNNYEEEKGAALAWIEKYGEPTFVDSIDITSVNPNQVWTEWWRSDQYVVNEYVPNEDGTKEITGYYITPNPWNSEPGSETVVTAIWEDCVDCDVTGETEDGDECLACEGSGAKSIELI